MVMHKKNEVCDREYVFQDITNEETEFLSNPKNHNCDWIYLWHKPLLSPQEKILQQFIIDCFSYSLKNEFGRTHTLVTYNLMDDEERKKIDVKIRESGVIRARP